MTVFRLLRDLIYMYIFAHEHTEPLGTVRQAIKPNINARCRKVVALPKVRCHVSGSFVACGTIKRYSKTFLILHAY